MGFWGVGNRFWPFFSCFENGKGVKMRKRGFLVDLGVKNLKCHFNHFPVVKNAK